MPTPLGWTARTRARLFGPPTGFGPEASSKPSHRTRLGCEALEDRTVPSVAAAPEPTVIPAAVRWTDAGPAGPLGGTVIPPNLSVNDAGDAGISNDTDSGGQRVGDGH